MSVNSWFETIKTLPNGLALGGGGAKGCYEVGLWKTLSENGIRFERVSGTSIGALVGAMYVENALEAMMDFIETIRPDAIAEDLFAFPETLGKWVSESREISGFLSKYILSGKGMDISPLKNEIDIMFNYEAFKASPINYACMTFNITERKPEAYFKDEMNEENAKQIILASASCYPAFPPMKMNGSDYIDGGYWDNVPVDLAAQMGAKKILAVNVEGPGIVRRVDDALDVFTIKPMIALGNFLDFSKASCMRSLFAGRIETGKLIGVYCGHLFTFRQRDRADLEFYDGYLKMMFRIYGISYEPQTIEGIDRYIGGYSPSDLSKALCNGDSLFELVEDLAFVCGMDPVRIYPFARFLNELSSHLEELSLRPLSSFDKQDVNTHRFLQTLAIYRLIKKSSIAAALSKRAAQLYPAETAMALVWIFMEEVYGENKNSQSASAGAKAGR